MKHVAMIPSTIYGIDVSNRTNFQNITTNSSSLFKLLNFNPIALLSSAYFFSESLPQKIWYQTPYSLFCKGTIPIFHENYLATIPSKNAGSDVNNWTNLWNITTNFSSLFKLLNFNPIALLSSAYYFKTRYRSTLPNSHEIMRQMCRVDL